MATAVDAALSRQSRRLSAEDFETASIRSAAPSYISEAPSYHSTVPAETIPAYTPRAPAPAPAPAPAQAPAPAPASATTSRASPAPLGLPPIPSASRAQPQPQLHQFRIPSWSTVSSNPTARHYHRVAHRRVAAGLGRDRELDDPASSEHVRRRRLLVLDRVLEQEEEKSSRDFRPLEDPYLVGEEAASRAKAARLARESGEDILGTENRRWDWFMSQTRDWEEREQCWARNRRELQSGGPTKLIRRSGRRW